MNRRRVVGWMVLLCLLVVVAAIAGGGVAYARVRATRSAEEVSEAGIVIASVVPDGPAAKAGVVRGDILLKIDDQTVDRPRQLQRYLGKLEAGDEVELTVLHGDDERTLTATLGERNGRPYLGLVPCGGLYEIEIPEVEVFPIPEVEVLPLGRGTLIVEVVPDSPADEAGLQEGDRIVAVDGQEPDWENDLADLITAYEPGDMLTLEIERPGEDPFEVTVELGEHPDKKGAAFLGVQYQPFPHLERFEFDERFFDRLPFDAPPLDHEPFFIPPDSDIEHGAIVRRVVEDSPADEAGLQGGDVITAVDGEPLKSPQALADAVAEHEPGDKVTLTVYRSDEDESLEIEVTLGEHPEKEGEAYLGVHYWPLPHIERFEWEGLPFDQLPFDHEPFFIPPDADVLQGAVIRDVADDSPADEAGLQEGDVITAIEGEPIESPQDLVNAVAERESGAKVTLTVYRPDEDEQEIEVTLAEHPDKEGQAYLGVTIGAFFRMRHFEGAPPEGMEPFQHFFDFDQLPFDWEWKDDYLPPDLFKFKEEPCCSGDSVL